MVFATAVVGLVALVGCGGDENGAASGRSTSTPTTAGPDTTSTTPGPDTTSTTGSPTTATGRAPAPTSAATTRVNSPGSTAPPDADRARLTPGEDFAVDYPEGWGPAGPTQATAFAGGATCRSALIVDRAPPNLAGPGASIEQSFVQACWRPLDGRTLQEFMSVTYGSTGGFQPTTLAGRPAFVSRAGNSSTFFVDTSSRRYQVATAVAASAELEPKRLAEVERILKSLSLPA